MRCRAHGQLAKYHRSSRTWQRILLSGGWQRRLSVQAKTVLSLRICGRAERAGLFRIAELLFSGGYVLTERCDHLLQLSLDGFPSVVFCSILLSLKSRYSSLKFRRQRMPGDFGHVKSFSKDKNFENVGKDDATALIEIQENPSQVEGRYITLVRL